jgi:hypothetical protein
MHIISQDLSSPSLKSAKHWISFAGNFFLDASLFIQKLEAAGSVAVDWDGAEGKLSEKPTCPICHAVYGSGPKQIKELQSHYQVCYAKRVSDHPEELIIVHSEPAM